MYIYDLFKAQDINITRVLSLLTRGLVSIDQLLRQTYFVIHYSSSYKHSGIEKNLEINFYEIQDEYMYEEEKWMIEEFDGHSLLETQHTLDMQDIP